MTRMIVDEGGRRRAFKIGTGTLAIGSGADAKLRLDDPDVAELHAELAVGEGVAVLRTRPGCTPPTSGGRPLDREVRLQHGVPVAIGGAILTIEYTGMPPVETPVAGVDAAPAAARAARAPVSSAARPGSARRARSDDESPRASSYHSRRKKEGAQLWLVLLLGVPIVGGLGWLGLQKLIGADTTAADWDPEQRYGAAVQAYEESSLGSALEALDHIREVDEAISPDLQARIDDLRGKIAAAEDSGRVAAHNILGTEYLAKKLKAYESKFLAASPGQPEIRFYVKRLHRFKDTWPDHYEMDWVDRQLDRFESRVDLTAPATYEEIEFEVKMDASIHKNRITREVAARADADFTRALGLLDDWLESADAEDRENGLLLLDDVRTHRDAWVTEQLLEARHHYERSRDSNWSSTDLGESIKALIRIVRFSGDPDAAADAAGRMLAYDEVADLTQYLTWYRENQPETFTDMRRIPALRDYMVGAGILSP